MAGAMFSSIEVARPTGRCAVTGRALAPGEVYMATLVDRPDTEPLERLDYTMQAWLDGARPEPPLRIFAAWKATVPTKDEPRNALIGDAELMDLFEQLEGVEEPRRVAFRFIMALLLIRKRLLKYEGNADGGRVLLVKPKGVVGGGGEGGAMRVIDPGMDDRAIADATEQLTAVLATGDWADDERGGAGSGGGGGGGGGGGKK